jgi:hypothetical protein
MSNNVKRGNRTKAENGWWPHGAPIGYLNAPDPEPIVLLESRRTNDAAQKNLRHLRTHDQITDAEFQADRNDLETERIGIDWELARLTPEDMLQPEEYFILFSIHAANWFDDGDDETKRLILETAGSNPVMAGGKLKIDAAYPFRRWKNPADISAVCSVLNVIRTHPERAAFGKLIHLVRRLVEKFGEKDLLSDATRMKGEHHHHHQPRRLPAGRRTGALKKRSQGNEAG